MRCTDRGPGPATASDHGTDAAADSAPDARTRSGAAVPVAAHASGRVGIVRMQDRSHFQSGAGPTGGYAGAVLAGESPPDRCGCGSIVSVAHRAEHGSLG